MFHSLDSQPVKIFVETSGPTVNVGDNYADRLIGR